MDTRIRHAWFPPAIPKRKLSLELDAESEWPSAYHALSGPAPGPGNPRPAKRLRALEGGLAGLSLNRPGAISIVTGPMSHAPEPEVEVEREVNQIHDASLDDGGAEPYISSIYEWASPGPATSRSSVGSLLLKGEVSEVSDEDDEGGPSGDVARMGRVEEMEEGGTTFVQGARDGLMGYEVYEPDGGHSPGGTEKRKRGDEVEMDESEGRKKKWYEPEKDRIVVLDLDSSEDESVTRSPRRRRSAFSLSSPSSPSSPVSPTGQLSAGRPRSQTEAPEYVISPALLSHLSPVHSTAAGILSIPREEDPAKAVVLFKPTPWKPSTSPTTNSPTQDQNTGLETQDMELNATPMDASPVMQDEDAMDVDS